MQAAFDEIEAAGSRGSALVGVPTGIADLDELTNGLHPGQMVVVAARPAIGKCLAGDTLVVEATTGELMPIDDLVRRGAAGEDVTVVDPRWLRPVDPTVVRLADGFRQVVTAEDNAGAGGFGDAVARALRRAGCTVPVHTVDLGAEFVPHGRRTDLLTACGVDAEGIVEAVRSGSRGTRRGAKAAAVPRRRVSVVARGVAERG
jgi:deoxyxylulose-5-phosphate synthase